MTYHVEYGWRMVRKKQVNSKDRYAERESQKYEHPIPSREFILEHLAERGSPATFRQLQDELALKTSQKKEALRRRLRAMMRDGQLMQNRRGAFGPLDKMSLILGRVIGHKDGFGFLVPEHGGGDLFLNARQMRAVFHDDKVLATVSDVDSRGRREGTIVEVLEHNTKELVGRFKFESGIAYVQPTNTRITQDILIPSTAVHGAKPGQMVIVDIMTQPSMTTRPTGRIKEILGAHMAPGMEIDVAIRNHDIPYEWPDVVLKEAAQFPTQVPVDAMAHRIDVRELAFVTIDGEDAKDFDDAVFCQPGEQGGWVLSVAIADVSYYVRPNTALDEEAFIRGNSVYFPERVIPMLPEALSNGLCSLNPEVDRLTMICEMHISAAGKLGRYHFYEGVIQSKARLTYNQVHQIIVEQDPVFRQQYRTLLPQLNDLVAVYRALHAARIKRGALDFELPETKIIFGKNKKIERIVPLQRNEAHRLIEECMLCANICAARLLMKHECPGLYRVHEGPSPEKLIDLRKFLGELGLTLPGKEEPTPKDYATLLHNIAGRPDAHVIQTVMLRSLRQAMYSPENKGHFGLAYDAYTHFTSPIRRYPDLIVHRSIKRILKKQYVSGEVDPVFEKYGEHCSMTERRADDATSEAVAWLKCEFMMDKVGEEFDGIISSVTNFGLFIELVDIYVEGLVHISQLPNDYYHFDPLKHEIYGERSRKRYRLGDPVKIKVVRVDLDQREMDFMLLETLVSNKQDTIKKQKHKKRKKKRTL